MVNPRVRLFPCTVSALFWLSHTTNCRESRIPAQCRGGRSGNSLNQQRLDQITLCNLRVLGCPLCTQEQTFAWYRPERPLL